MEYYCVLHYIPGYGTVVVGVRRTLDEAEALSDIALTRFRGGLVRVEKITVHIEEHTNAN